MNPGVIYLYSLFVLLVYAGGLRRSGLPGWLVEKLCGKRERTSLILLVIFSFLLSPIFLGFELLSHYRFLDIDRRKKTILFSSVVSGSIVLPIGNMRNLYVFSYLHYLHPENPPGLSPFLPLIYLYSFLLVIHLVLAWIVGGNEKVRFSSPQRVRWQEIVFSGFILLFTTPYMTGRLHFPGYIVLTGILIFAFVSRETLKLTRWEFLLSAPFAIVISFILARFPLNPPTPFEFAASSILPWLFSSTLLSFVLSSPMVNFTHLLFGLSCGSLAGGINLFEYRKLRFEIDLRILLPVYILSLIFSLIILLLF